MHCTPLTSISCLQSRVAGGAVSAVEFSAQSNGQFRVNVTVSTALAKVNGAMTTPLAVVVQGTYSVSSTAKTLVLVSAAASQWNSAFGVAGLSASLQAAVALRLDAAEPQPNGTTPSGRSIAFCGAVFQQKYVWFCVHDEWCSEYTLLSIECFFDLCYRAVL